jgi:hypothetical protein
MEPDELLLSEYGTKSPAEPRRGLSCSTLWLSYKSILVAFWMHLCHCRCFQVYQKMLLQSQRALYLAPGGPGSIWKYSEALVRSTRVSGKFACGFRTDLAFADQQWSHRKVHSSSNFEEDNLDHQQEVLRLGQARWDKSLCTTRVPLPKK